MSEKSDVFTFKERGSDDSQAVTVRTDSKVFVPTSTTNLLLSGVRERVDRNAQSALDIGCGCGIVAVVLKKLILPDAAVYASDISEEAIKLTRQNARDHGLAIDCRCGSLFEPWSGTKFDVIVDDVAGICEPLARRSSWYPPEIHSDAGDDGTRWIVEILKQAPEYLSPRGQIFFPVLTLSNEEKILGAAKAQFDKLEMVSEQWYPFGRDLLEHIDLIEELDSQGIINVRKKGSRLLWATKIYLASN